ncbi:RHS repeat domain-containing protein, partial [Serratia ficaria]|uniref:RHS repeat domain-containing protein n=2 Tax=Serratia ficaria TaxID=61651 RepID=UPI0021BDD50F
FRYTGRGELAGVSDALRGEVHYGYDAEGRLLQHREPAQGKPGSRLVYDMADNLLGEKGPNSDVETHLPLAPVADNRLTHWQKLFYRYDAWGNLISRRNGIYEQHYRYDADNRLIQARGRGPQGEFDAQYHYDALGRRTRKTVSYKGKAAQTTRFVWQGYRLLQEQRADGSRRSWSYDPASPWSPLAALEQAGDSRSAEIYWYHTDLNSAPLEVSDAAGNLRWSGQYDTFGKLQGQTVEGAARRNGAQYDQPLRYAGQYQDDESGLHYNLFRYYEPEVGRFTTQDPIGLAGGFNLYAYGPNPLTWIDPFGLSFLEIVGDAATTTGKKFQGAEIYKITSKVKVGDVTFKKGDYFYLDNLHKDHYETFSSLDKSKGVFNLDGSYNERKSIKTAKRKGPGC